MNANHDPEAARSTCCFPVQIAYNFYCHGRNSSLMEARLISVLVLRPGCVPCVLLPSPFSPRTPPSSSPCHRDFSHRFSLPFLVEPLSLSLSYCPCNSDSSSSRSHFYPINDIEHAGCILEEYDRVFSIARI